MYAMLPMMIALLVSMSRGRGWRCGARQCYTAIGRGLRNGMLSQASYRIAAVG